MKKITVMLMMALCLFLAPAVNAAEKELEHDVTVRLVFGFGKNYNIEKFSKFAMETVGKQLDAYTMFDSKGVWRHEKKGLIRENNMIIIFDSKEGPELDETIKALADSYLKLFGSEGGSMYAVKTPISSAIMYSK